MSFSPLMSRSILKVIGVASQPTVTPDENAQLPMQTECHS
jgi:hypothetical protein